MISTDLAADESWRFTPIGVLARKERDAINFAQARAFAKTFGLPLVKWKLRIQGDVATCLPAQVLEELYAREDALWGWFVEVNTSHEKILVWYGR